MALVRNTADLIRLLPPLAIVLSLAFLSPKHLRSTVGSVRIDSKESTRQVNSKDEVSFAIVDSEAIAREEKRGFENGSWQLILMMNSTKFFVFSLHCWVASSKQRINHLKHIIQSL
ncbi:hypothetical protein LOK49_LG15G01866 [Camellia lanceoleosa]|uniref:Uncharacterized protein n=1 Tax=Camellia lanceoleosa TaxID=1840588 RepID=A0ACC0F3F1_9ERIC|nr:hypothetical protein LOK49_LG15G01866 [Camellia lanceoleosa]